jgi:integral membrane sensor domain MASE1
MNSAGRGTAGFVDLRGVLRAAAYALEFVAIAVAYFGLAVSGLVIPWLNSTATPLWPPTGLALALLLLRGYWIWPAIAVGAFFSSAVANGSPVESAFIAIGAPLAALTGAWLTSRWSGGRDTFTTPLGVIKFALIVAGPAAIISSTIATAGLFLANNVEWSSPAAAWTTLWLTDAAGTLIVAPAILLWAAKPSRPFSQWSLLDTIAILVLTAAIAVVAYGPRS